MLEPLLPRFLGYVLEDALAELAYKKARDYLVQQMEKYFFGSGADVAAGYIPPSQK